MEPLAPIVITAREIYDAVVRLTGRMDVVITQQEVSRDIDKDHEARLRSLERGRWPLPALAALLSVAALILTAIRMM